MSLFTNPQHFLDLLLLLQPHLFQLINIKLLNRFLPHRSLLHCFSALDGVALHIERPIHTGRLIILFPLQLHLFVQLVVGIQKVLLDALDHLPMDLPVFEVHRIAILDLLYFLLLISLFDLLVALR